MSRGRRQHPQLWDEAWLRENYATKSTTQMAREIGCGVTSINRALHRAGIPLRPATNSPYSSREERFTARVEVGDPDECWPWVGARHPFGYGQLNIDGRRISTHRIAWERANGPIPSGLQVLHRCDNPPCCNPTHLFLGTQKDNMQDAAAKGRTYVPRLTGEAWHAAHG